MQTELISVDAQIANNGKLQFSELLSKAHEFLKMQVIENIGNFHDGKIIQMPPRVCKNFKDIFQDSSFILIKNNPHE
jgi:hypothetical protein